MSENVVPLRPLPLHPLIVPAARDIRPRPWVLGYWLMRGAVTLLAAPGGTGKTALLTGMILSCATGRDLVGAEPLRPLRVAMLGLEEGREEMSRRFAAAMMHFDLTQADIGNRVLYMDGKEHPFSAAFLDQSGQVSMGPDMESLNDSMLGEQLDVLFIDPLALAHKAPENDNTAMAAVLSYFSAIADASNVAVCLLHHTRKGAIAGDPDSIRGAGALVNHARIALGLAPMSEEEAQLFNLTSDDRRRLVRLDDLKMNYAQKAADAKWIKLESVKLGNIRPPEYPYGDSVQVATVWSAPAAMDGLTIDISNQILDEMDAGKDGERYSNQRNTKLPAFQLIKDVMAQHGVDKNDGWCRRLVGTWIKNKVIAEAEYHSEAQRKNRKGLFVNAANRPGKNHD
jgi:hypothetical protein